VTRYNSIKDLEPREPVGAVLSVGVKGPTGAPIDKDKFHILEPVPGQRKVQRHLQTVTIEAREHHPRFKAFNEATKDRRKMVTGQFVHATVDEAFQHHLKAYRPKGQPVHPLNMPFCVGDGVRATRYRGVVNGEHVFGDGDCPHDRCEFRQAKMVNGRQGPKECKPWMQLLFRIVWEAGNMPTTLMLLTSKSWNNARAALGLFAQIKRNAEMVLGAGRDYTLGGFVFSMTLGSKTNKEQKSRYPVITFAPVSDPIDFFTAQLERDQRVRELLGAPKPVTMLEYATPEQAALDLAAHDPGVR
jgi:hypothetical protein